MIACKDRLADLVLNRGWCLLASVPLKSRADVDRVSLPFEAPSDTAFKKASARRLAEHGVKFRKRLQRGLDRSGDDVFRDILWTRASGHFRNAQKYQEGAAAVLDAFLQEFGVGTEHLQLEKLPNGKQVLRHRIRTDAVAALLQRRESRQLGPATIRGLRADASPKLHAEIMAMEMETLPTGIASSRQVEHLPGSTLVHGMAKLPHKLFNFLWGVFLVAGPTLDQVREALGSILWVVTDQGVEASIADAADCISAWCHLAQGLSVETCPPVNEATHLLPNAVFVPGWCHLWSNMIRSCCSKLEAWPARLGKLRAMVRFLKTKDYRHVWAAAMERVGKHGMAEQLRTPFGASFASWRFETLPDALGELHRLSEVCTKFFSKPVFGAIEDTSLLNEVAAVCTDAEFWTWLKVLSGPMCAMERARLWGTWCSCHDASDKSPCPNKSRRLHEVHSRLDTLAKELLDWQSGLSIQACDGRLGVMLQAQEFAASAVSEIRLRFRWAGQVPYLFSNVCDRTAASRIMEQWLDTPKDNHHRVTVNVLAKHAEAIQAVAGGGLASAELQALQCRFRQIPLNEAPIEGYHAEVQRVCARAHGGREAFVFAELRLRSNIERLRRWYDKLCGRSIVAYEWNRYKRVLRLTDSNISRDLKCKRKDFEGKFYRLRAHAFGDVSALGAVWHHRLSGSFCGRSDFVKLKKDYLTQAMTCGFFYTVCGAEAGQERIVFRLLAWQTGKEKLVDLPDEADHRDEASIQVYCVWRQEGSGDARRLTVYPDGEPQRTVIWRMAESWQVLHTTMRCWEVEASDTEACLDLKSPVSLDAGLSIDDPNCPAITMLQALRGRGWAATEGTVVHTQASRVMSVSNAAHRSPYFQVLLQWEQLPWLDRMRSDLVLDYYRCVLKGYQVPPGRLAAWYASVLANEGDMLAIVAEADDAVVQEATPKRARQDRDVAQPSDSGVRRLPQPRRRPIAAGGQQGSSSSSSSGGNGSESSSSSSSGGNSSSSSSGGNSSSSSTAVQEAPDAQAWPAAIEGQRVTVEARAQYSRIIVSCPHHPGCKRKRNTGLAQRQELGDRGPVAFLATWILAGEHLSKEAHQALKPVIADQKLWLERNPR